MAKTYEPIATTTLGSAVASHTFSSIPATYTDLVLVHSGASSASVDIYMRFNSDSATNYSRTFVYASSGTAASSRETNQTLLYWNYQTTDISTGIAHIMNYANTTTFKTVISRENPVSFAVAAIAGIWRKTPEAINSITIGAFSGTMSIGSTITLYGIKAA